MRKPAAASSVRDIGELFSDASDQGTRRDQLERVSSRRTQARSEAPLDLLVRLRGRGVVFMLVDGRLRVRAPNGVLSDADRDSLRAERDAITALLHDEQDRPPGLLPIVRHAHRCNGCRREFRCTTPSCVAREILCVCCKLDGLVNR